MKRTNEQPAVQRRQLLGAAGTTGALVAAATLLATRHDSTPAEAAEVPPAPEKGGGYQVTAHVLRYYQTAKV
jgi:hypothetical protein